MSLWRREAAFELHIGQAEWQLGYAGRVIANATFDSLDELARSFEAARIDAPPSGARRVSVTVHEHWVRSFTVEPPRGLRCLGELRGLAADRMERLFGVDPQTWTLRGEWHASRPFVLTALPSTLIRSVRTLGRRMNWKLVEVVPSWVRALASQPRSSATQWWAIAQPGVLTLARVRQRQLAFARSVRVAADAGNIELAAHAERERKRCVVDTDAAVHAMNQVDLRERLATMPVHWPALSVAHDGNRRTSPLALPPLRSAGPVLAAAVGLAALVLAATSQLSALHDERAAVERQLARARTMVRTQPPLPAAAKPIAPREIDAFNAVVHRLNTPWPDIFAALERATPRDIALLGLEPDDRQARLRGSGQARDHRAMLDYVDRLSAQWPFTQARLLRHELDEKDGARPLRFQFELSVLSPVASKAVR